MNCKRLRFLMEMIFIFILPLLFILCCFHIEKEYTYDNNGNYETSKYELVFNSPIDLNTHEFVSNSVFNGYEIIESYGADENIYTCINDMHNNYNNENYYVNINNFDIINYYGELRFRDYDGNEINVGGDLTIDIWDSNATIFYNISGSSNGGDWWDNNIILIDVPSFYNFLDMESDNSNMSIDTFYIGEGYFDIYRAKYLNYNSYEDTENPNLFGKIESILCNALQISSNIALDIIIVYTFLWFIMFVIWHLFYLLLDFLLHFWRKEEDK